MSVVKGWCPGAYRPMLSGDGYVFRVRPPLGHLEAEQVLRLCAIAAAHGGGTLDVTSRANLQVRGVAERDRSVVERLLGEAGLLDADPALEARRNIVIAPDWTSGDLTHRLGRVLTDVLPELPPLPAKMGFAVDTGDRASLADASADFRFELDEAGALMLRADGAPTGVTIAEADAILALQALVAWFVETGGPAAGRMARHLAQVPLPDRFIGTVSRADQGCDALGRHALGLVIGAPFGSLPAQAFGDAFQRSGATGLRCMPGRRLLLLGASALEDCGAVTEPDDPRLSVHACPGAPGCASAHVQTRALAERLADHAPGLHVSGCAKGCAHPRPAPVTLTGRADGRFDLIRQGCAGDAPQLSALTENDILRELG